LNQNQGVIVKNCKNDFTEENLFPNIADRSSEELGNDLEKKMEERRAFS
jgi:hypothetical protein